MSRSDRQLPLGVHLSVQTRLEDFVPGANREALQGVLDHAEGRARGPLFLYGPRACGKTHLLQGLSRLAGETGRRSAYLPLGEAGLEAPGILEGWESLDAVCLDRLERVAGDAEWERALMRLYEGLSESGGSLVVAAASGPRGLDLQLPDLASRLAAGPVYQLAPLDDADLATALRRRLGQRGLELPDESARWLLRRARRDMHSLAALADELDRLSLSAQRRLTIPFLRETLDRVVGD